MIIVKILNYFNSIKYNAYNIFLGTIAHMSKFAL